MTPEVTPTPATPQEPQPGATPSPLNGAQLASLTRTEEICRIALRPEYLTALVTLEPGEDPGEDHITEAGIQTILDLCADARGKTSNALNATGRRHQRSAEEDAAEENLVALVREFQARARQKHFARNPERLVEYGVGLKIAHSRAVLEGWAQTILDITATDPLPRITEAKRAELQTALTTYKATQTSQSGATGEASGLRIDRNSLVNQATEGRMWIQFAADAEWPHTDPANTPIRREFKLPGTRPFVG